MRPIPSQGLTMNQPPLVTLIDPDPKGLATLTYSFEKEGFTAAGTSDFGMATQLVRATRSRLAVVSIRPPERQALAVIGDLRQGAGGARIPVLALGAAGSRAAAIQAGAFDFLDTPLMIRDAIVVSRLLLLMREPAASRDEAPEIQGSLDDLHGLFFLMRAMSAAGRSGVLQLARGHRKGEVKFFEGAVNSVQTRSLQAFPALHQLLLWRGAALSLKLRDMPRRTQFSASGGEILEECERFLRDVTHAARQLGSLQSVYTRDSRQDDGRQGGGQTGDVPPEVAPVARLFDGARTLGEVIEDSPFRVFDTLRVVKRLVDSHALMSRGAGVPAAPMSREPRGGREPPAAQPVAARSRIKTASLGVSPDAAPLPSLDSSLEERRGLAGERRKSVRRTPAPFEKPAAKPAPAPIPLVAKKSPSGGFAAGEIRSPKVMRPTPHRGSVRPIHEPTVQVSIHVDAELEAVRTPRALDARAHAVPSPTVAPRPSASPPPPVAAVPAAVPVAVPTSGTAPISARQPMPVQARPKKVGRTPVPNNAHSFSALEADFFAREADLYKDEGGETFEDLERGGDANARSRPGAPRTSSRGKKR